MLIVRKPGDGRLGEELMVTTAFRAEPAIQNALREIAREEGRSVSSVVRDMLLAALAKHERQQKASCKAPRKAKRAAATEAVA